ncbi:phosphocarrier protein HPr, partial [Microbacterium esteraromaticum]
GVTGKSKVIFQIEGEDEEELSNSLTGILAEYGI